MRTSHQKCERCKVNQTHKRAKYNMCPPCRAEYRSELEAQRARARAKRIDPVMDAVLDEEIERKQPREIVEHLTRMWSGPAMPKVKPEIVMRKVDPVTVNRGGRPSKRTFTDEQKLEIGRLYEEGWSYDQIHQRIPGINNGAIAQVARDLGLPPRHKGPRPRASEPTPSPDVGEEAIATALAQKSEEVGLPVPPSVEKALERMMLPPKPEPVLHSTHRPDPGLVWQVRVEGLIEVHHATIEDALAHVRKAYPSLRVTGIQLTQ